MAGLRYLFITKENQVYKITTPKNYNYPAISELKGEYVLEVILYYETLNRKPYRLLNVTFDRLQLNDEGRYVYTLEEQKEKTYNYIFFIYNTPEELSKKEGPIILPRATIIPTQGEKEALKRYIEVEIPQVNKYGTHAIEEAIQKNKAIHRNLIQLVKDAAKLRSQMEREEDREIE